MKRNLNADDAENGLTLTRNSGNQRPRLNINRDYEREVNYSSWFFELEEVSMGIFHFLMDCI